MEERNMCTRGRWLSGIARLIPYIVVFAALIMGVRAMCLETSQKLYWLGGTAVAILVCFFLGRAFARQRAGWLWIVLIALVPRALALVFWNIQPISDFDIAQKSAVSFWTTEIDTWRSLPEVTFFSHTWPNLMPWVLYEALVVRLFGSGILPLQILNVLWSTITCVLIYKACLNLTGRKAVSITAGLLQSVNFFHIFATSVLTCQHIALCLMTAGLCFLLKRTGKTWLNWLLGGLLLGLSHLMRTEMAVVLIAVFLWGLYRLVMHLVCDGRGVCRRVGSLLLSGFMFFAAFIAVVQGANAVITGIRATDRPITSGYLKYKIMVGLNTDTNGGWSQADADRYVSQINAPGTDLLTPVIRQRLSNDGLPALVVRKLNAFLGSYLDWFSQITEETEAKAAFSWNYMPILNRAATLGMTLLAMAALVRDSVRLRDDRFMLLVIMLTGFILAYALIEVQTRYAQVIMPFLAILAACAFPESLKASPHNSASRRAMSSPPSSV